METVTGRTRRCRLVRPFALGRSCLSSAALPASSTPAGNPPNPPSFQVAALPGMLGASLYLPAVGPSGSLGLAISAAPFFSCTRCARFRKAGTPQRPRCLDVGGVSRRRLIRRKTSTGRGFAPTSGRSLGRPQFARSWRIAQRRLPLACCPLARDLGARRAALLGRPSLLGAVARAASRAPVRRAPPSGRSTCNVCTDCMRLYMRLPQANESEPPEARDDARRSGARVRLPSLDLH